MFDEAITYCFVKHADDGYWKNGACLEKITKMGIFSGRDGIYSLGVVGFVRRGS
jgi:hypothetical protein